MPVKGREGESRFSDTQRDTHVSRMQTGDCGQRDTRRERIFNPPTPCRSAADGGDSRFGALRTSPETLMLGWCSGSARIALSIRLSAGVHGHVDSIAPVVDWCSFRLAA